MKSALFLLYAWLPKAHGAPSAPSIVSAILSGIQVKAGLYLLARMIAVFGGALVLNPFFMAIGFATAISGFLLAIAQSKIKLVLAYSTISQIGLMVIGLATGEAGAYWGSVFHMINHALAKSLLFLTAGVVIHVYGTKELDAVRGVLRRMPGIGIAMAAGILAIIGTPLFNGSISKYMIQGPISSDPLYWGILFVNLGTTVTFVKFGRILVGTPVTDPPAVPAGGVQVGDAHSALPDVYTTMVALVLGAACVAGGIFATPLVGLLFQIEVSLSGALTMSKLTIFVLTIGTAVVVVRLLAPAEALLERIRSKQLYFTDLVLCVLVFFVVLAGYLSATTS
jgi:multicomponent Na+:H+ antiporter subunit D